MKTEVQSVSAAMLSALAALPWGAITGMVLNGTAALLGVAGSVTATAVGGWIAPVLICASVLLIGRSFYVIYVCGIRTRATVVIAWSALVFMVGFWTWQLTTRSGGPLMCGSTRCHRFGRTVVMWVLAASAFWLSACGSGIRENSATTTESSASVQEITLHVPGMIDRQGITGLAGSNVVQEALSGLPGIEKVGVDLKKDLLHIRYDPAKVTREQMLQAIDNLGYEGKVVQEGMRDEGPMANDQGRRNDEARMTKGRLRTSVIRHSSFFRHWSLDLRHSCLFFIPHPCQREASPMPSLLRSILGCLTLGKFTAGRGQSDSLPADVVAHVPGLTGPRGGPDRARRALGTLPWVEQGTIQMNFKARELRFCLKDKSQFDEEALKRALKAEGFPGVQVKTRSQESGARSQE